MAAKVLQVEAAPIRAGLRRERGRLAVATRKSVLGGKLRRTWRRKARSWGKQRHAKRRMLDGSGRASRAGTRAAGRAACDWPAPDNAK